MPATHEDIRGVLESPAFDESDKWVVMWQFRYLGDFETALVAAIARADEGNLDRLALGFPMQVDGYRRWAYGNLAERLRKAGLDI